ncbi:transglutaminase domain-containing protein [Algimonas porphyrae]|uniref:Transglutaminase n=1 Tax=Algimonas porphyrae TaxID=1128113 RepID=A0ABQ5V551_9PROT|nr:transglutaminase family protein [Algimonas porphyrae]GLQ21397.1 transglutaminase [Algimonas porphyrae]
MQLSVRHQTRYDYGQPVHYALLQVRLRPREGTAQQSVGRWTLTLDGASHHAAFVDQHGNHVDLIELIPGTQAVTITVDGEIETHDTNGIAGAEKAGPPLWLYTRQTPLTRMDAELSAFVETISGTGLERLHALSQTILQKVPYETGATVINTSAADALRIGRGVCQDHSHIFIACARHLGIPARYVSGYLMMDDRDHQDASHAWAEAYVDGLGWVGFDISNGISPDERYVKIAQGQDYAGCAPTRGFMIGGQQEQLEVSIQVQQ